jgi:hypothetical protein
METLTVIIIIAVATAYLIKTFFKGASKSGGCACGGGCSNCPPSADCAGKKDRENLTCIKAPPDNPG